MLKHFVINVGKNSRKIICDKKNLGETINLISAIHIPGIEDQVTIPLSDLS